MALTRKFLKAMGIDEEKVDEIIEAHGETVTALKEEITTLKGYETELTETKSKLEKANKKIEKYEKDGAEELVAKSEYDTLKSDFDKYKGEVEAKELHTAKEHAFRELLKAVGVNENRISAIVKVSNSDIDSLELDENGKIKDAETHTESIKTEWADFIETTTTKGANIATPPMNSDSQITTKKDIMAIKDYNERISAIEKHPELFVSKQ